MFLAGEIIVAGFVGKLFRGFLHMLMDFGQNVWRIIRKVINIVEFVLKFFLCNGFMSDAIDLVDLLVSIAREGALAEILLRALDELEKVEYGVQTGRFFAYPRHTKTRKILRIYIAALVPYFILSFIYLFKMAYTIMKKDLDVLRDIFYGENHGTPHMRMRSSQISGESLHMFLGQPVYHNATHNTPSILCNYAERTYYRRKEKEFCSSSNFLLVIGSHGSWSLFGALM